MRLLRRFFRLLDEIFSDGLTQMAGVVFVLIIALVLFNMRSELPERYPLFGVFLFAMVPVLVVVGGIIFVMAILKYSASDDNNEN